MAARLAKGVPVGATLIAATLLFCLLSGDRSSDGSGSLESAIGPVTYGDASVAGMPREDRDPSRPAPRYGMAVPQFLVVLTKPDSQFPRGGRLATLWAAAPCLDDQSLLSLHCRLTI